LTSQLLHHLYYIDEGLDVVLAAGAGRKDDHMSCRRRSMKSCAMKCCIWSDLGNEAAAVAVSTGSKGKKIARYNKIEWV
jgi:hypothetical protein